jgi:hypothetical protein
MLRKRFYICIMLLAIPCCILAACTSPTAKSTPSKSTVIVHPTPTPVPTLQLLGSFGPDYHIIYQTHAENASAVAIDETLTTFPAQKQIVLMGQCVGTGKLTLTIKDVELAEPTCNQATPTVFNFTQGTFTREEQRKQYALQVHVEGDLKWEVALEVANTR